jgi:hypothetical protein
MNTSTLNHHPKHAQPVVRIAAGLLIVLLLLTWFGGLPFYINNLQTNPDAVLRILFGNTWTPQAVKAAAVDLGIEPTFLAWYWLGIEIAVLIGFGSAGLIFFFRKKDNFGLFIGVVFVLIGTRITGPVTFSLAVDTPWVFELMEFLSVYSFLGFTSLMYLFPNGRFVPAWTIFLLPAMVIFALIISNIGRNSMSASIPGFLGYMLAFAIGIASQGYRYLRVATPQEKLQMKWALVSFFVYLLLGLSVPVLNFNIVDHHRAPLGFELLEWMVFYALLTTGLYLFILALAVAIFRYHLYDIDIIIRRTLIYSLVTALLALVFFGSVVLFQALFLTLTGEQSQLAIAISTLAIAALFMPLRRRAQIIIDRRFYRQKYDATRLLAEFNDSLRDNLDLEDLKNSFSTIIEKTMQPATQFTWFKPATSRSETKEPQ